MDSMDTGDEEKRRGEKYLRLAKVKEIKKGFEAKKKVDINLDEAGGKKTGKDKFREILSIF